MDVVTTAPSLVFGTRTAVLLLLAAQGLGVAALLLTAQRERKNRAANRFLAALVAHFSVSLVPDIIGFAGFYDRWPWLTFAPFDPGLLAGPLMFLYVASLTGGRAPRRWGMHLVAPALELAYLTACFALPLATKDAWEAGVHERLIAPVLMAGRIGSLAIYLALSVRAYRRYQRWLVHHVSFGADFRLPWLVAFLAAMALLLLLMVAFLATSPDETPRAYFHWFWLHLALAVISFVLGIAGLLAGSREYAVPGVAEPTAAGDGVVTTETVHAEDKAAPDASTHAELGQSIERRVRSERLWRDQQLTLGRLARQLGIPEGQLSRGLNHGLGLNFNEFVNRLRVEAVQQELDSGAVRGRSLLAVAFDAGFSSKASFNRAFKAVTGRTPSEYRGRQDVSTSG